MKKTLLITTLSSLILCSCSQYGRLTNNSPADHQHLVSAQQLTRPLAGNVTKANKLPDECFEAKTGSACTDAPIINDNAQAQSKKAEAKQSLKFAGTVKRIASEKLALLSKNFEIRTAKASVSHATKPSATTDDGAGLRTVGWIVLIIGLVILIAASILVGILLMLLGLIFVLAGGKKSTPPSSNSNENQKQMEDVVYLKNGGVTRGTIIEQTPNVSLKIKMRDGSIFVYKMDEIDRIAKEEVIK